MAKIILVGPAHPLRGCIADFNEAFAESLQKDGHHVEIVSFKLQYPNFLFPGKTQYRKQLNKTFNYKISSLISSINPFTWIKTYKYICSTAPDKVFVRFWMPFFGPCLGYIVKKLKQNNLIVYGIVDNAIPHEKRIGDSYFVKYFLNKCDGHYTLSEKVKNEIKTLNNSLKVTSLFHPVYNTFGEKPERDVALNKLQLKEGKYLLFFGLVRKYKGIDLAIEAMSHPAIKEMGVNLIIAGEFYEDRKKYDQLIEELNLNNIIICDEFIPKDEVPNYFEVADLVLLPYITATQSGVTQLSIYYEKPMVVTNVGGLPEVIDHREDGFVAIPNSSDISKHILDFYRDRELRAQIEAGIKKKSNEYSWKLFNERILQ